MQAMQAGQPAHSPFMVYGIDAASQVLDWRRRHETRKPPSSPAQAGLDGYRRSLEWQNKVSPVVHAHEAMQTPVITVEANTPLLDAWKTLRKHGFGHLPVVTATGRPIGMVSSHGMAELQAQGHGFDNPIWGEPVARHMTTPLMACSREADVHDIARVFLDRKIGSLAVVEGEAEAPRLIGIVTRTDLLRCLMEHPSLQLLG